MNTVVKGKREILGPHPSGPHPTWSTSKNWPKSKLAKVEKKLAEVNRATTCPLTRIERRSVARWARGSLRMSWSVIWTWPFHSKPLSRRLD